MEKTNKKEKNGKASITIIAAAIITIVILSFAFDVLYIKVGVNEEKIYPTLAEKQRYRELTDSIDQLATHTYQLLHDRLKRDEKDDDYLAECYHELSTETAILRQYSRFTKALRFKYLRKSKDVHKAVENYCAILWSLALEGPEFDDLDFQTQQLTTLGEELSKRLEVQTETTSYTQDQPAGS